MAAETGAAKKTIDLGDDDGFITVKLCGKEVELCPGDVIAVIGERVEKDQSLKNGLPFLRLVQQFVKDTFGAEVSINMAEAFYSAMVAAEKDVADFFAKRLASLFTSGSTPGALAGPGSAATSPVSTDSLPSSP